MRRSVPLRLFSDVYVWDRTVWAFWDCQHQLIWLINKLSVFNIYCNHRNRKVSGQHMSNPKDVRGRACVLLVESKKKKISNFHFLKINKYVWNECLALTKWGKVKYSVAGYICDCFCLNLEHYARCWLLCNCSPMLRYENIWAQSLDPTQTESYSS